MNKINVFYNYYSDNDPYRKNEIDSCLKKLVENQCVSQLFVVTESENVLPYSSASTVKIQSDVRPTFAHVFSLVDQYSHDSDVNVILNSDCFFLETAALEIINIDENSAYCISRVEVKSMEPLTIRKLKTIKNWSRHSDTQDAWIIRGKPKKGMFLDYYFGKPGCDNRLAYELQNAGYDIVNPRTKISIFHYHTTELHRYGEPDRVPEPYAFPKIIDTQILLPVFSLR